MPAVDKKINDKKAVQVKILKQKNTVEKNQATVSIENHTRTRIDKGDDLEVVVMKNIVETEDNFIFRCLFWLTGYMLFHDKTIY